MNNCRDCKHWRRMDEKNPNTGEYWGACHETNKQTALSMRIGDLIAGQNVLVQGETIGSVGSMGCSESFGCVNFSMKEVQNVA